MLNKCINCNNSTFEPADGNYAGYERCTECKFITSRKVARTLNINVPEDPNDKNLCEGCQ